MSGLRKEKIQDREMDLLTPDRMLRQSMITPTRQANQTIRNFDDFPVPVPKPYNSQTNTPNGRTRESKGATEGEGTFSAGRGKGYVRRNDRIEEEEPLPLPKLSKPGYRLTSDLSNYKDEYGLRAVNSFGVINEGVGSVVWDDPIDVRDLDLDRIVEIEDRMVSHYCRYANTEDLNVRFVSRNSEFQQNRV